VSRSTIAAQFDQADAERSEVLARAREAAAMTLVSVLPAEGRTETDREKLAWQSLGAECVENVVGKTLLTIFPPDMPWFEFAPHPRLRYNAEVPAELLQRLEGWLYSREMVVQSQFNTTNYRDCYRTAFESLLVAGNMLVRLRDDYRFRNYRLDQWVQHRDSANDIVWLITREAKDPATLTDEQLAKAQLRRDQLPSDAVRRDADKRLRLYTHAERQTDGAWVIRQEMNGHILVESQEPVSPFLAAGYDESTGEHYSRGFVDRRMGDLRGFNGMSLAMLDGAAALARLVPVADPAKGWRAKDLMQPNGQIVMGRVSGNVPDGLGFVQSGKTGDFNFALVFADRVEKRLGRSMLLETASQPTGERVTATQIMRVAKELEGAMGGVYAKMANEVQRPLIDRMVYQMERDRILPPIPADLADVVETNVLTGMAALSRQASLDKLMAGLQILTQVPGAMERLDMEVVADRVLRALGIDTQGLVKTPEQMQQEFQEKAAQYLQSQAGQQAIETIGKVVEARAQQNTQVQVA